MQGRGTGVWPRLASKRGMGRCSQLQARRISGDEGRGRVDWGQVIRFCFEPRENAVDRVVFWGRSAFYWPESEKRARYFTSHHLYIAWEGFKYVCEDQKGYYSFARSCRYFFMATTRLRAL